jgi:hypothetical protein
MINLNELQIDLASSHANWENEGGAVSSAKGAPATSWFVPPLVVPTFLFALFLAHVAYLKVA